MLPALLTACSALDVLNATVPSDTYRSAVDIPYGDHPRQKVDVYMPSQSLADKAFPRGGSPMVVFFYGGSWSSGDRADYRFVGEALAARGIAVVVADYRLSPDAFLLKFHLTILMALPFINILLAGGVLFLAMSASGLAVG